MFAKTKNNNNVRVELLYKKPKLCITDKKVKSTL